MEKTDIFQEMREARERELDEHFSKIISKLEIRTKENPLGFLSFLSGIPSIFPSFKMVRVYDNWMKLEDARSTFGAAYNAIADGTYYDAAVVGFDGPTDEYFFREGVRLARGEQHEASERYKEKSQETQ